MTAWGKITAKRDDGVCCNCDAPMGLGTTIYWLKGTKGYQCSVECNQSRASKLGIALDASQGTKTGQTPPGAQNDHPMAVCVVKAKEMALCAVCGGSVPEGELAVFIDRDNIEWTICTLCRRMAKAQRNLKILGLWKPVKREDVVP